MNKVVVWDPKGEFWDGGIVDDDMARMLEGRGVALLPVNPEEAKHSGIGGYVKRSWGAGWPLDTGMAHLMCKVAMFLRSSQNTLHWKARLIPTAQLASDAASGQLMRHAGTLQVAADNAAGNLYSVSLETRTNVIQTRELGNVDAHGGWTVGGHARMVPYQEGVHGFALYGAMPGVRVAWVALSAV